LSWLVSTIRQKRLLKSSRKLVRVVLLDMARLQRSRPAAPPTLWPRRRPRLSVYLRPLLRPKHKHHPRRRLRQSHLQLTNQPRSSSHHLKLKWSLLQPLSQLQRKQSQLPRSLNRQRLPVPSSLVMPPHRVPTNRRMRPPRMQLQSHTRKSRKRHPPHRKVSAASLRPSWA